MAEITSIEDRLRHDRSEVVEITFLLDPLSDEFEVAYTLPENVDHQALANSLRALADHIYKEGLH